MAAAAAAWALALPLEVIKKGLESFGGGPGRFNVFKTAKGAAVVVDYAHNPSAVDAMVAALDRFPQPRRTLVFAGCNRREIDLFEMGRAAGGAFDRVLLYEDRGNNGCADGELNAMFRKGLKAGQRVAETSTSPTNARLSKQR